MTIGFVEVAGDPRHEPIKAYGGWCSRPASIRSPARRSAIDEAQAITRVLKIDFALERITVKSAAEVAPAVVQAMDQRGHPVLHRRCAGRRIQAAGGRRARARRAAVQRHGAGGCVAPRGLCARDRAYAAEPRHEHGRARAISGLAQMARSSRSSGPAAGRCGDGQGVRGLGEEIRRAHRRAESSSSPAPIRASASRTIRRCSRAGNRDYDVVFVADDAFEFARQVPYQTVRARPVVGSIDLEPVAWHWTWEHNGAPQVNSRFQKLTGGRHMEGADWAAWMAVKMVVQAAHAHTLGGFRQAARLHPRRQRTFDGDKGLASACGPGTTSCGRRSCSPRLMRWSRARRSRASCTRPTFSTRSATTSRRRRAI